MDDISSLMEEHYVKYASYVILDRAIPHLDDGLKPVQRRILWTLWQLDDGKLHKVANVSGQTMTLHPHGDAAISEALVNMANKGYLLDTQGNFGNPFTGDPSAAGRYIETRLSPLARENLFNKDLMTFVLSYDGRKEEPVVLSCKIPLLLLQGVEGIAVGMSTKIFPHNFVEVLEAVIASIEGKSFTLAPDFFTGGTVDISNYEDGKGKIRIRAKIEIKDPKTLIIKEICYGSNTESLIRSIDEAAKKGNLKIDSIHDYTSDKVEVEIKLPRGTYAEEMVDALYHFTECETTLHAQPVVIVNSLPHELTLTEMVHHHRERLLQLLRLELEIERDKLKEKIFGKSLEALFVEHRLYKAIEELADYQQIHKALEIGFQPFEHELLRLPNETDREKLLSLPIRRISLYDMKKNREERTVLEKLLEKVEKDLKDVKKVAIRYLKELIKKHGENYPRKTTIQTLEAIDTKKIATKHLKVGFDPSSGFVGTEIQGEFKIECTNYDKILLVFDDGSYKVISVPEKQYVLEHGRKVLHIGIADKKTSFAVGWIDPKTKLPYGKRFVIDKFILDKDYRYLEEGSKPEMVTIKEGATFFIRLQPKPKQKLTRLSVSIEKIPIKGVTAKGIRLASRSSVEITDKETDQFDLFSK